VLLIGRVSPHRASNHVTLDLGNGAEPAQPSAQSDRRRTRMRCEPLLPSDGTPSEGAPSPVLASLSEGIPGPHRPRLPSHPCVTIHPASLPGSRTPACVHLGWHVCAYPISQPLAAKSSLHPDITVSLPSSQISQAPSHRLLVLRLDVKRQINTSSCKAVASSHPYRPPLLAVATLRLRRIQALQAYVACLPLGRRAAC
jgi:hypothetical protein